MIYTLQRPQMVSAASRTQLHFGQNPFGAQQGFQYPHMQQSNYMGILSQQPGMGQAPASQPYAASQPYPANLALQRPGLYAQASGMSQGQAGKVLSNCDTCQVRKQDTIHSFFEVHFKGLPSWKLDCPTGGKGPYLFSLTQKFRQAACHGSALQRSHAFYQCLPRRYIHVLRGRVDLARVDMASCTAHCCDLSLQS